MEILLLITVIVVAGSSLYVAASINGRLKRNLDAEIKKAKQSLLDHVTKQATWTADNVTETVRVGELERGAREGQLKAERKALLGRLNAVESMLANILSIITPGLDGIRDMAGRTDARQAGSNDSLNEVKKQLEQLTESLIGQTGHAQQMEKLVLSIQSTMAVNFSDLAGSLGGIAERQSAADSHLAEISRSLDRHLGIVDQAVRHDNWTADQLLSIGNRLEARLDAFDDAARYLRGRLDGEITQAMPDAVTRVISASLSLGQPTRDIVQELFTSFCEQLPIGLLLPAARDSTLGATYLLWKSVDGEQPEGVLTALLAACADDSAETCPGLGDLRSLLAVLHDIGDGTIRLGPMVINRTSASLLGCVVTEAEARVVCFPDGGVSSRECEERLRGLEPDQLIDLTSWADRSTLVGEEREAS